MKWLQRITALLVATVATTVAGSVTQTQFNLARLAELGAAPTAGERLQATALDLAGFGPTFGALALAGFFVAFTVTGALRRWIVARRTALYALAGAVAILTMLLTMQAIFGLTAIAAARGLGGFAALVACGVPGGWLFARLTAPRA